MTTLFAPAAEQVLHANLTFDFYRMIAATRKRETKLRPLKALSNYGIIINAEAAPRKEPPRVRLPKFSEGCLS
jgi:hypothetical protein